MQSKGDNSRDNEMVLNVSGVQGAIKIITKAGEIIVQGADAPRPERQTTAPPQQQQRQSQQRQKSNKESTIKVEKIQEDIEWLRKLKEIKVSAWRKVMKEEQQREKQKQAEIERQAQEAIARRAESEERNRREIEEITRMRKEKHQGWLQKTEIEKRIREAKEDTEFLKWREEEYIKDKVSALTKQEEHERQKRRTEALSLIITERRESWDKEADKIFQEKKMTLEESLKRHNVISREIEREKQQKEEQKRFELKTQIEYGKFLKTKQEEREATIEKDESKSSNTESETPPPIEQEEQEETVSARAINPTPAAPHLNNGRHRQQHNMQQDRAAATTGGGGGEKPMKNPKHAILANPARKSGNRTGSYQTKNGTRKCAQ